MMQKFLQTVDGWFFHSISGRIYEHLQFFNLKELIQGLVWFAMKKTNNNHIVIKSHIIVNKRMCIHTLEFTTSISESLGPRKGLPLLHIIKWYLFRKISFFIIFGSTICRFLPEIENEQVCIMTLQSHYRTWLAYKCIHVNIIILQTSKLKSHENFLS